MIALPEYPAPNPKFPPRGLENRCFGFRPAFTLIELMVVIVIIGILAAATTGVAVKVIASQRRAATQLLVDTINNALATQASKLVDQTRKAAILDASTDVDSQIMIDVGNQWNLVFVNTINGITAINNPAYFATMLNHSLNAGSASFNGLSLPNGSKVNGGGKNDPTLEAFEKAFCLYLVLKVGRFSSLDPESLGGNTIQFGSDGSRKVPFLADQWGDPIYLVPEYPSTPISPSNRLKALSGNL